MNTLENERSVLTSDGKLPNIGEFIYNYPPRCFGYVLEHCDKPDTCLVRFPSGIERVSSTWWVVLDEKTIAAYKMLWRVLAESGTNMAYGYDDKGILPFPFSTEHGIYKGMKQLPPRSQFGPAYHAWVDKDVPNDIPVKFIWDDASRWYSIGNLVERHIDSILALRWEAKEGSPLLALASVGAPDPLELLARGSEEEA